MLFLSARYSIFFETMKIKFLFFIFPTGILEAGWIPPTERAGSRSSARTTDDPDVLYNALKTILNATKNHQSAWPFLVPVDRKVVADYYDHIKYPMDLRTMTERLKSNYYCNKRLFIADIKRIISNCRSYNAPDTEYYNCAGMMEKYVMSKLRDHGFLEK